MLPLLLMLIATQAPAVPGEGTLVSHCKQGMLSACEALRQVNPQKAAELERYAQQALKVVEEAAEAGEAAEAVADAAPEPPDCKGQNHHVISNPIAKQMKEHKILGGLYEPRDKRFIAKAKDEKSHCGYQKWHRDVDKEVVAWLKDHGDATPEEFMKLLRDIYKRKDMLERFPNGF